MNFIFFFLSFLAVVFADKAAKKNGEQFLESIAIQENIYKLKSGVLIQIVESTTNPESKSPLLFDVCDITFVGSLIDGSTFISQRATLNADVCIKGLTETLQLMAVGN
jgi:FKBP-type peptidyl-prolyl cis-trans isomerase